MQYLRESGNAAATCNNRLAAIRAYLWYVADGDISIQSAALTASHVPFLKVPKLTRETISEEDLLALLSAPSNTRIGKRDQMILILLYDSAIRDATTAHIRNYLKLYHPEASPDVPFIYTVIKGNRGRMSVGNVEHIIKKYADQIRTEHPNLPKSCYPHMVRRTRATNLYQDGIELELISRILGHSSTEITRIYATPLVEMIRKAMESGSLATNEPPEWPDDEAEMARLCGPR